LGETADLISRLGLGNDSELKLFHFVGFPAETSQFSWSCAEERNFGVFSPLMNAAGDPDCSRPLSFLGGGFSIRVPLCSP
jgi:hypothetical protein